MSIKNRINAAIVEGEALAIVRKHAAVEDAVERMRAGRAARGRALIDADNWLLTKFPAMVRELTASGVRQFEVTEPQYAVARQAGLTTRTNHITRAYDEPCDITEYWVTW